MALMKTVVKVLDPFLSWAAVRYQAAVGDVLRKHGLRYEDLYDPLLNQVLPQDRLSADIIIGERSLQAIYPHIDPFINQHK